MIELTKCKQKIFDIAVELFSNKNYELVSLDDVAVVLGRTKPSIYSHFKSKQEILDTIYDYFCEQYCHGRPTMEELDPFLKEGTPLGMIKAVAHNHVKDFVQNKQLIQIVKIVYQRTFVDERAHEIAKALMMDSALQYVETAFNRAIEIGRFTLFDIHFLAVVITNSRFCMIRNWLLSPTAETLEGILKEEETLDNYVALFLNRYLKENN